MSNENSNPKTERPTLGVILPNYNHSDVVGRAIDAIAGQTRPPDQLIIVDDGSTDDSVAVIEKHIAGLDYVDFIRMTENTRLEGARSAALDALRTDYLYNTSADDYIRPEFFEQAMDMVGKHPEAGVIFGNFVVCDEKGEVIFRARPPRWEEPMFASPERFYREYLDIIAPTDSQSGASVYRTDALREMLPYRRELHTWKDTFINWTICLKHGCCYIPYDAMVWNVQGGTLSQQTADNVSKMLDINARAVWLMRSDEFAGLYDSAFVKKWSDAFRRQAVDSHMAHLRMAFEPIWQRLGLDKPGGLLWKEVDKKLLRGLFGLFRWTYLLGARAMIEAYRGDVRCLESR